MLAQLIQVFHGFSIFQIEHKLNYNWYLIVNPRRTILLLSLYYLNMVCALAHLVILIFIYKLRDYQYPS